MTRYSASDIFRMIYNFISCILNEINNKKTITIMRENLLKKQPTWGLRRAQGTGQKSATPATLTKVILVLLITLLLPLGAWAVDYPITVAGVQVTDANATNVLNDDETATVSFTPASDGNPATLTLNGATFRILIT